MSRQYAVLLLWVSVCTAGLSQDDGKIRQDKADSAILRFPIVEKGKWGYIDETGKTVVAPQFDDGWAFGDGLAFVKIGKTWGSINETGQIVINPQFDDVSPFIEGLACVKIAERYGYVDKTGKYVINPQFEWADNFSDGMALIRSGPDIAELLGYIDSTGNVVIEPQFEYAARFSEGRAVIRIGDGYGYIDKTGKIVVNPQFDLARDFSEGLAAVAVRGKWGYIDKTGNMVIRPQFDDASCFSKDLATVRIGELDQAKCGYIDKTGTFVVNPQFDEALWFSEDLGPVRLGKKWGFIDRKGKYIINPQFDSVDHFYEGLAAAKADGKWGYIDRTGAFVVNPQFEAASPFFSANHFATVRVGDSWGYINREGKYVWKGNLTELFGLEVVLVIDTTWTMRDIVAELRESTPDYATLLSKVGGVPVRIGIVAYRDKAGGIPIKTSPPVKEFYHTKLLPPTDDVQELRAFADSLEVGPGPKTEDEARDYERGKGIPANEDVYAGLSEAVKFPQTGRRIVILITDALPHNEDVEKINSLVSEFANGGNAVHSIYSEPPMDVSGLYGEAKRRAIEDQKKDIERVYAYFKHLARMGGGQALSMESLQKGALALRIAELVFGRDKILQQKKLEIENKLKEGEALLNAGKHAEALAAFELVAILTSRLRRDIDVSLYEEKLVSLFKSATRQNTRTSEPISFFGILAGKDVSSVIFVVDRSASMEGEPLKTVKAELMRSVQRLTVANIFNVIFFSDAGTHKACWPNPVLATTERKQECNKFTEDLSAYGGTNPTSAMETAIRSQPDLIYLLTDGEFEQGKEAIQEISELLIRYAGGKKIKINTIAFRNKNCESVLRQIASLTGGQYRYER